ncbi:putative NAD(P)-binding domain-containing protein [Rosa chinensis]|uniref:Putative NAD(P)-binding domain-containing protein n=1 Tax=Rosa chinensis TaxID=74649 RepID=A0A2P6QY22_ROSCH|nr:putative NAD(P)-binding domain-containing protein [Rosa chinensis]
MATIAIASFIGLTTPITRTQGLSGHFPNPSSPFSSLKYSQFRTTFSPSMATTPIQVSASSSSSSSPAIDEKKGAGFSGIVGADDLLIVGPGVLGRLVAEKWRQEHPGCEIYGQTVTVDHHEELIKVGINPCLKGTKTDLKFPNVIFCAPPSRTSDYPGDVRVAALNWNGEGSFLFTSSSAPYDCNDNSPCDEDTPVVPIGRSPRTDVLLNAEKVVLEFGEYLYITGKLLVLFQSDLNYVYKADRGAHVYWLSKGTVDTNPDHVLNLIHYEDAASLSVAILKKQLRNRILLGCDNHPLSRKEVMDLVNKSGKFTKVFESFTGTTDPLGKRLNNSKTRAEIGWEPKYPSFSQFLESL